MRKCGILMPIFSLPSKYGIGTFGKEAYRFVDFLKKGGQSLWQILPLNPTNYGDSPYQSFCSYAGNPYFIDIEALIEEGLLKQCEADICDFGDNHLKIDYGKLYENRLNLLRIAFKRFSPDNEYNEFCSKNKAWLLPYSLFMAIKKKNNYICWNEWEKNEKDYNLAIKNSELYTDEMNFHQFVQYEFFKQWFSLKNYANKNGIKIIGDMPIYVAFDSADVWSSPSEFQLDKHFNPLKIAGCPPDAFSDDGQLWGNPLYRWDKMKSDNFKWWKNRFSYILKLYDIVRIDHFRGFESYYAIPFGDKDAVNGRWEKGPDIDFFKVLNEEFGDELPIIAEDLGYITPEVHSLLKKTGFPGMKVLQFAFSVDGESNYLPHNIADKNCIIYTGTHDNDTNTGWLTSGDANEVDFARHYLGIKNNADFNWSMIKAALMSVADTCILTMADLVSLGSEGRINTPATCENNWTWRIDGGCINDWLSNILYENTALYSREAKKEGR